MTVGYKFLAHKHLDSFLSGNVQLGTAKSFRMADGQAAGRSDPNEISRVFAPGAVTIPSDKFPFLDGRPGVSYAYSEGTRIIYQEDAHLFCVSKSIDRHLRRRMLSDFEADCFVKITNMEEFGRPITNHKEVSRVGGFGGVTYSDPVDISDPAEWAEPHPLDKAVKFEWQNEMRWVWPGNNLEPKLIFVPEVKPLLHYLPSYRLR